MGGRGASLIWGVCVMGALTIAFAAAPVTAPALASRPTVLLFHGGGFVFGEASAEHGNALFYRRNGFNAVSVEYPLGDLPAAHRMATVTARRYARHGAVVAAGTSAGGGIAAYLAAAGVVRAAVGVCPLTNYVVWKPGPWKSIVRAPSASTRARYSTSYRRRVIRSPLRLYHSPDDTVVPYAQSARLARRPNVSLTTLGGDHCEDRAWRRTAARFLRRSLKPSRPSKALDYAPDRAAQAH
jgi:acetyl esterase/lipase